MIKFLPLDFLAVSRKIKRCLSLKNNVQTMQMRKTHDVIYWALYLIYYIHWAILFATQTIETW